ncbi:MAG: NTP transferase domain-containing protein [bacterium]
MNSNSNTSSVADLTRYLQHLSIDIDAKNDSLAIILAAGHGKRIKSHTSKMLHKIWGAPTVMRVAEAAKEGLGTENQIIVVGIKARDVAEFLGKSRHRVFVFQAEQRGTGDAVRTALSAISPNGFHGDVYIFPGDMGLLHAEVVKKFKMDFLSNKCDMMVLTGQYEGNPSFNTYGRILRVPAEDISGRSSGDDFDKVIEIKEHKDILALNDSKPYSVKYNGHTYEFSKQELINVREFNTGVFAFKADKLQSHIHQLKSDNVQNELYVTDLISIFNRNGLTVKAAKAKDNKTVLGFNEKSVLREMERIAREQVYDKLKNIITIEDKDDFFIADDVVQQIIELDKKQGSLDIVIGKGVYIDNNVHLSKGVQIGNHAHISGNVYLGENVKIQESVNLSTYKHQTLRVGSGSELFKGDIIKGNLTIGENCLIESSVNMTGSDEFPTRIGNNVTIKGTSYIFGSIVEDNLWIEHSVLKCKHVEKIVKKDGSIQPIRYVLPLPEGLDSIKEISGECNYPPNSKR